MNARPDAADPRRPATLSRRHFLRGLGASIALPAKGPAKARQALLDAVARVNAICAAKID